MLEVCFSESVKGALAVAQHCKKDVIGIGAFSIIVDDKRTPDEYESRRQEEYKKHRQKQIELQKYAIPLGGKKEDIVAISFALSEGDIQAPISPDGCPRKDYIESVFSMELFSPADDTQDNINRFWHSCIADLTKLQSSPDKIRIWVDNTPDAQCGLLFIADLFRDSQTEIHVVELPAKIKRDNSTIVEYRGWGDVEPQLFGTFLSAEKILTKEEIQHLADQWQKLKEENASLRVVENGAVISTDESYYDDKIRLEFPDEPCKVSFIIGHALGRQNILTGDVFIAKRVQHFIDNGELAILEDPHEGFYQVIIRRAR